MGAGTFHELIDFGMYVDDMYQFAEGWCRCPACNSVIDIFSDQVSYRCKECKKNFVLGFMEEE